MFEEPPEPEEPGSLDPLPVGSGGGVVPGAAGTSPGTAAVALAEPHCSFGPFGMTSKSAVRLLDSLPSPR